MKARAVVLYNNKAPPESEFKGSNGLSWFIELEDQNIMLDVGYKGSILIHNMEQLGLHPDDIDTLILSHAHIDHTGALTEFLEARSPSKTLKIIAHPSILEPKRAFRLLNIGLPNLDESLKKRTNLQLTSAPYAINPFVFTTGEIFDRTEKDGTGWVMQHFSNDTWTVDPILDDLSLVLSTKEGMITICGCCHAGLINTCNHVSSMVQSKITHILGGTHTRSFTSSEMEYIADRLELDYEIPRLSLGHCVGRKQFQYLQGRFGSKLVDEIRVGSEYKFTLSAPDPVEMDVIGQIKRQPS
jgi:7,8-dihydropterin-6-yl-methyl-4-(beta-D-ribofuranosyl)aminobenzene 5'-phosphate synthase